jgi:hypothetical protein
MKRPLIAAAVLFFCLAFFADCSKSQGNPDLALVEVGCQGGNLYFTVANRGNGDLPRDWEAAASVTIDGSQMDSVLLTQPTSRTAGGLEKAGGSSLFLTAYDLEQIVRVDIALDYTDQIGESNEENNVDNNIYVAPCSLPDLVVDEVSLDENCFLTFKLRNAGVGEILKKAWAYEFMDACAVSIYLEDKQWACIPLISLDPSHLLERAGGAMTFKSELKITPKALVTVIADSTETINESEEQNNKAAATLACAK